MGYIGVKKRCMKSVTGVHEVTWISYNSESFLLKWIHNLDPDMYGNVLNKYILSTLLQ